MKQHNIFAKLHGRNQSTYQALFTMNNLRQKFPFSLRVRVCVYCLRKCTVIFGVLHCMVAVVK